MAGPLRSTDITPKSAGEPHTPRESWDPNRQIRFAAGLTSTGPPPARPQWHCIGVGIGQRISPRPTRACKLKEYRRSRPIPLI
jgi:hypothetical protein